MMVVMMMMVAMVVMVVMLAVMLVSSAMVVVWYVGRNIHSDISLAALIKQCHTTSAAWPTTC